LKPDHAPALLWLAQIELERRQVDRAKELLDRYKQVSPPSGLALFLLGQLAALRQDYTDAVRQYEAALVVDPQAGSVHYPLALAYQKLGNEESARRHLALRGSREPGVPDALLQELKGITTGARTHLLQGAQAMQAGDHEAAARQFRLAIEADPDDPTASLNLGAALLAGGKVEEGIRELERALQLALDPPNRSMVYFNLGVIAQARGRSAEAIEHFRQAVRWNPRNTQARQRLEALVGQTQSAPPL
jgi:Tfp pilus assembly protein PilF